MTAGGVNYVGHPIHGAASGFIWLDHEDGSHAPSLGFSKQYWLSRGRATAWAAAAMDRYLILRIEQWTGNRVVRAVTRTLLNPSRALSNAAQGRMPWFRLVRPLR